MRGRLHSHCSIHAERATYRLALFRDHLEDSSMEVESIGFWDLCGFSVSLRQFAASGVESKGRMLTTLLPSSRSPDCNISSSWHAAGEEADRLFRVTLEPEFQNGIPLHPYILLFLGSLFKCRDLVSLGKQGAVQPFWDTLHLDPIIQHVQHVCLRTVYCLLSTDAVTDNCPIRSYSRLQENLNALQ